MNRVREHPLSEEDTKYYQEQIIPRENHEYDPEVSYITLTNKRAEEINNQVFLKAPVEDRYIVKAIDKARPSADRSEQAILDHIPMVPLKDKQQHADNLEIWINGCFDIVANLDTLDGLTNGTPGRVRKVDMKNGVIWYEPDDKTVGKCLRRKHAHLCATLTEAGKVNWIPLLRHTINVSKFRFTRKQFPLRPSTARTVDRTQGSTLTKVIQDFSDASSRKKTHGASYVSASRCPTRNNFHALGKEGLALERISQSPKCSEQMAEMRLNKQLNFTMPFLNDKKDEYASIMFLNAQSILGKLKPLSKDWNVAACQLTHIFDSFLHF